MEYPEKGIDSGQSVSSMPLADAVIANRVNHRIRELLGIDFLYLKHIGAGISGNVYLCEYTGNDTNIKSLCDSNNRLSVKIPMNDRELLREAEIAQQLYDKRSARQIQLRHLIGIPIKKDEKIIALITPYISYLSAQNDVQEDSLKSYLKCFYDAIIKGSVPNKEISDKFHNALYNDYQIMCVQFINEMHSIILEFHALGFLHLDIASRNFILNKPVIDSEGNFIKFALTLCDYGHADRMVNGSVNTYHQRNNKPLTARDHQDIVSHIATPKTDIFAFKCAVIGMLSMTVADLMHDYSILDIGQKSIIEFREIRSKKESLYREDTAVLAIYLNKLIEHIKFCSDVNIGRKARELIDLYKNYLGAMPLDKQDITKVHELDHDSLLFANDMFFKSVIKNRESDIENVNNLDELKRFMLSVKRLMQVPVSKAFEKSDLYTQVKELDSIDKVKRFIKSQRTQFVQSSQKENIEPVLLGGSDKFKWIDMLENAILNWKSQHNIKENKWFGNEFEKNVNDIINGIMKGKITSLEIAQEILDKVKEDFAHKIALKKTSSTIEFKKSITKHDEFKENHPLSGENIKHIRK